MREEQFEASLRQSKSDVRTAFTMVTQRAMMSKTLSEVLAEEPVRGGTLEPALAQPVRPSGVPVKWVDEARARCTESHALEICGQRSTINDVLEQRASRP